MYKTFRVFAFFICILSSSYSRAQNDTTYYTEDGVKTDWMSANYYQVIYPKVDGRYKVEEHYTLRNRLKMTGYSIRPDSINLNGPFIAYDNKGHKTREGNYVNNRQTGLCKLYYENSDSLWAVANYSAGMLDGELTSYYKDGKLKRKETYEKQKPMGGKCYDEGGKEIAYTPFCIMPKPAVDVNAFLNANLQYPLNAREHNIQGKVILKFSVLEDGTISKITVVHPIGGGCDEEAARVLFKMPKWKPGMNDDVPVKAWFTLPITFKLE